MAIGEQMQNEWCKGSGLHGLAFGEKYLRACSSCNKEMTPLASGVMPEHVAEVQFEAIVTDQTPGRWDD